MGLTAVKPYYVARAKAIGLSEHSDAFNDENIASTLLGDKFHVKLGAFSGTKLNQADQEVTCPVTVTIFVKGYANPSDALDKAVLKTDLLVKECLKNSNRLGTLIKNVRFDTAVPEALAVSNDNAVKVTISFTTFVIMAIS